MSESFGQLFKDWMIATGKSRNTASNYFSGVNIVSKHCGRDLFAISDLAELKQLYGLYGSGGEYAAIGASNSNNVQCGLVQWLAYQSERQGGSADVIEGYANGHVSALLRGRSTAQVSWFWMVVRMLRTRWPKADHYTANTTPPDVRVGQKSGTGNGKVAFHLRGRNARQMTCDARDLADHVQQLSGRGIAVQISSEDHSTGEEVGRWLDSVTQVIRVDDLPLKGEGRMPSDYQSADAASIAAQPGTSATTRPTPALNQILYGPPGTGKTYETIDAALEVLAPELLSQPREQRKQHFDEFVAQQRIRFVTFHQSFSYEDFVEGLRALPPESEDNPSGALAYDVAKGVFVQLCLDATGDPVLERKLGLKKDPTIWKISIEEAGSDGRTRRYCFQHGEARIGWHKVGDIRNADLADPSLKLGSNDRSSLTSFANEIEEGDVLVCLGTRKSICAVGVVTGEYEYNPQVPEGVRKDYVHRLPVNWLLTDIDFDIGELNGGRGLTLKTVYPMSRINWPELQQALQQAGHRLVEETKLAVTGPKLPYVLIVDEINRGNISRIFGELITLIEPSKRAGAAEALEAVLPYSKRHFSVPDNVYLIGTMNTADRSLAGLDIALRRRFVFREMPPRPDLLDGVELQGLNIGKLLRVMNQRIEVLLDRDHCLGHAYFMPLTEQGLKDHDRLAKLELIFRNQILPLLQEYFFEDWQRIQWVLNDHRKPAIDRFVEQDKQDLAALFGNISVPAQGGVWRINMAAFKRLSAYAGVIAVNAKAEVPDEEPEEADA